MLTSALRSAHGTDKRCSLGSLACRYLTLAASAPVRLRTSPGAARGPRALAPGDDTPEWRAGSGRKRPYDIGMGKFTSETARAEREVTVPVTERLEWEAAL